MTNENRQPVESAFSSLAGERGAHFIGMSGCVGKGAGERNMWPLTPDTRAPTIVMQICILYRKKKIDSDDEVAGGMDRDC